MGSAADDFSQRERSRSPRRGRSRSPNARRSYSPRDRSRSRHRRRSSRSPMTGQGAPSGGSASGYSGAPYRSHEDRAAHREQVMNNIRETSQQDRRVYVGNLSYDVKWHHLKDFMRQGESQTGLVVLSKCRLAVRGRLTLCSSWRSTLCRCSAASEWNVEGGLLQVILAGSWFPLLAYLMELLD